MRAPCVNDAVDRLVEISLCLAQTYHAGERELRQPSRKGYGKPGREMQERGDGVANVLCFCFHIGTKQRFAGNRQSEPLHRQRHV